MKSTRTPDLSNRLSVCNYSLSLPEAWVGLGLGPGSGTFINLASSNDVFPFNQKSYNVHKSKTRTALAKPTCARLLRRLRCEATTREGGRQGPGSMPTGPGPTGVRSTDTDMGRLGWEATTRRGGGGAGGW